MAGLRLPKSGPIYMKQDLKRFLNVTGWLLYFVLFLLRVGCPIFFLCFYLFLIYLFVYLFIFLYGVCLTTVLGPVLKQSQAKSNGIRAN